MTRPQPTTAPTAALERASGALAALRDRYRARYGEVVFEVRPELSGPGLRLVGQVLLGAQRRAACAEVERATGLSVADGLEALVDREAEPDWAVPAGDLVDVRASPGGELATQVSAGDPPLRRLARRGDWWAVEVADGTVGWAAGAALADVAPPVRPASVPDWRRGFRGEARAAPPDAWRRVVQAWEGTPYLWGGTTAAGIDCSGLTQRVYRQVLGLGLPRHSTDQAGAGRRVPADAMRAGDLLLLTGCETGVSHVAIVLEDGGHAAGHASHRRGVVEEPLADLLGRYRLRSVRRFGPAPR